MTAHVDSMPLSATNAAGGTRVIGVGCRYYTTLRRGVFICELLQPTAGVMNEPAGGYIIYTIVASCAVHVGRHGVCHLHI